MTDSNRRHSRLFSRDALKAKKPHIPRKKNGANPVKLSEWGMMDSNRRHSRLFQSGRSKSKKASHFCEAFGGE
jgi:hypothetical protein